jgi:hypothetical protein
VYVKEELLEGGVSEREYNPAGYQEDHAPREISGRDEQGDRGEEKSDEDGGRKDLVRKVRWRTDYRDDFVMSDREIVHAILEIAEITKEVLGRK